MHENMHDKLNADSWFLSILEKSIWEVNTYKLQNLRKFNLRF